jgi:hypothetical protein
MMTILFVCLAIFCGLLGLSILFQHFIAGKEDHGIEIWKTKDGRQWLVAYVEQADLHRAQIHLQFDGEDIPEATLEAKSQEDVELLVRDWFNAINASKVD